MGRRNERDSGPGMDSSLPWAQPSGYGPEQGGAGQYPPPPYSYESAEGPNGLPYPPPLPNGYPPGMYPAAPDAQPAAAEDTEEEEEERYGLMPCGGACQACSMPSSLLTVPCNVLCGIRTRRLCAIAWQPSSTWLMTPTKMRPHEAMLAEWTRDILPLRPTLMAMTCLLHCAFGNNSRIPSSRAYLI